MPKSIVLDSTPLNLLTMPKSKPLADACQQWLLDCANKGAIIVVPEIADYEVRRELIRRRLPKRIAKLDALKSQLLYLSITTEAMLRAAALWAEVRQGGFQTADPHALDGDVILAAQTLTLYLPPENVVIATANVSHLSRLTVPAAFWQDVTPA